jgi:hypothetical protein
LGKRGLVPMKFFVPGIDNSQEAENRYQGIKKFLVQVQPTGTISERRVRSITFHDRKKLVNAVVGKQEPWEGMEIVVAIFESTTAYLICTKSRGVRRGIPYIAGRNEVVASEDFEP